MTLADQIVSDVSDVFLKTDEHAETVTHYPQDDRLNGVSRTALVFLDEEDDAGGDVMDRSGERIHRQCLLELPASVTVNCENEARRHDTFLIGGELWRAHRIRGRDAGAQTVELRRNEQITTKRSRVT